VELDSDYNLLIAVKTLNNGSDGIKVDESTANQVTDSEASHNTG
jgi:hypothetical protein